LPQRHREHRAWEEHLPDSFSRPFSLCLKNQLLILRLSASVISVSLWQNPGISLSLFANALELLVEAHGGDRDGGAEFLREQGDFEFLHHPAKDFQLLFRLE
jgi:hypothetical protein